LHYRDARPTLFFAVRVWTVFVRKLVIYAWINYSSAYYLFDNENDNSSIEYEAYYSVAQSDMVQRSGFTVYTM